MTDRSHRTLPIALLAGMLVLAGCGVKGPLEPPAGSISASPNPLQETVVPDRSAAETVTTTPTQTATSKAFSSPVGKDEPGKKKRFRQGNVPVSTEPVKPDRPFILDDLL